MARIPFSTYQVKKSVSLKKLLPEPGVLTIYIGKLEIPMGNSNGSPHSVWEALENMGCGIGIFLLFSVSLADVDIVCGGSLSHNVKFNCLMFMHVISTRMVYVSGKHP